MDFSKVVYYLNQGGPAAWTVIAYAGYQLFQLLTRGVVAIEAQNELMRQFVEKSEKGHD